VKDSAGAFRAIYLATRPGGVERRSDFFNAIVPSNWEFSDVQMGIKYRLIGLDHLPAAVPR
jgi:hypothetical protein